MCTEGNKGLRSQVLQASVGMVAHSQMWSLKNSPIEEISGSFHMHVYKSNGTHALHGVNAMLSVFEVCS